jgi:hypothetical protein
MNTDAYEDQATGDSVDSLSQDDISIDHQDDNWSDNDGDVASQDDDQQDNTDGTDGDQSDDSNTDSDQDGGSDQADDSTGGADDSGEGDTTSDQQGDDAGDDDLSDEEAFVALSEETGVEVNSDEDIVSALTELAQLRQQQPNPLDGLSPAIQQAIEVEKSGGDLADHFRRTSMDFEKMDATEVLRQKFFKDNSKLYKANPKLAQMKFERNLKDNYGRFQQLQGLEDIEKEDFLEQHGQENIEYEELMFQNDVEEARNELSEWQKSAKPEAKSTTSESQQGLSEDEAKKIAEKYMETKEKVMNDFKAVTIPIGDNADAFALGLNESTEPLVTEWANNPATFLEDIGFNNGEVDIERLMPIMTLIAEASNGDLGGKLARHVASLENIETFRKTLDKPPTTTSPAATQDRDMDDWDAVGEAAIKARQQRGM